jgi:hypothetical protein
LLLPIQVNFSFSFAPKAIFSHSFQTSNVECVELLLERGAQPNSDMLLVAYDEARLACLLSHGCEPEDIPTFLHHCIRSKGFVHPDLDNKRFLPVTRQPQSSATPDSNPVTNAKQAAMAQVSSTRKPKQYVYRRSLQSS